MLFSRDSKCPLKTPDIKDAWGTCLKCTWGWNTFPLVPSFYPTPQVVICMSVLRDLAPSSCGTLAAPEHLLKYLNKSRSFPPPAQSRCKMVLQMNSKS